MKKTNKQFEMLCQHVRQTNLLTATEALLEWDQQTKMPTQASNFRSQQITHFAGEIYRRQTDPRFGEWLNDLAESNLAADPHSDTGATIRELKREYDQKIKLPLKLVEELAGLTSLGQQTWIKARAADDFSILAPTLKRIFHLKRQQAEALGYEDTPYDALLNEYEPHAKTSEVSTVLEQLRKRLVPLVEKISGSNVRLPVELLHRYYPIVAQEKFSTEVTSSVGFNYQRGRLDTTHHPFCTELGPDDCRITTRYDERFFGSAFFGTLHEAGHGMYEQGLRSEFYGLPPGRYCSLGIHESQSRLWENLVGRRLSFWQHFYSPAQEHFPDSLADVPLTDFYRAVNHVEPSLIRVEADEVTYNLHIIVRFELEQELLSGDLEVDDLPNEWNARYEKYLGLTPPSDRDGVLQDVHWSAGLVGYFPTYSLGNLFASQLFVAAERELGSLDLMFRMGEFQPLQQWLNQKIYQPGMCYSSTQLRTNVTGLSLSPDALITQITEKLTPLYGW